MFIDTGKKWDERSKGQGRWGSGIVKTRLKEPVNALTHIAGALLAVVGSIYLIWQGWERGPWHLTSFLIFGISLILLYTSSGVDHAVKASP